MIGPRLFRSRWSALFWAGGILWTAYNVADATPDRTQPANGAAASTDMVDATGVAVDAKDLAVLANMATSN